MAMSQRRIEALRNMASMGTGQEAQTASAVLARQRGMISNPTRKAIGSGVKAGSPARLPIRGAIGSGSGGMSPARLPIRGAIGPGTLKTGARFKAPTKPLLGGVNTGMMHGPMRPVVDKTINQTANVVKESKKGMGLFKNPRQAALIGAGLAVAGTVAMNRRGEGASSGRQSMYRY